MHRVMTNPSNKRGARMIDLTDILQSVVHWAILDLTRKLADAQNDIDVSSDMSADDVINALNASHKHMMKIQQQYNRVLDLAKWWQEEIKS